MIEDKINNIVNSSQEGQDLFVLIVTEFKNKEWKDIIYK
jgi:hypothetical protein